jgi:hypothetical protein
MRVLIQTVVAGILVALASVAFIVVLVILVIAVAFIVLGKILGGAGSRSSRSEAVLVSETVQDAHPSSEAASAAAEEAERRELILAGAGGAGTEFHGGRGQTRWVKKDGTITDGGGSYAGRVDVQADQFGMRQVYQSRGSSGMVEVVGRINKEGYIYDAGGNCLGRTASQEHFGVRDVLDGHGSASGASSKREK